jgi:pyridoxal phosphate enzyme (YggS family)
MTDEELRRELKNRLASVRQRIVAACERVSRSADSVQLVAVSKTVSLRVIQHCIALGQLDFGENRPQTLWPKAETLPQARWHFIGHLQRNKLDRTVDCTHLLHSADSLRLLQSINDYGRTRGTPIPVLLEINCSGEPQKGGFEPSEVPDIRPFTGVVVQGLMTMAAQHDDPELCRPAFAQLRQLKTQLEQSLGVVLSHLSMGMSNDFEVAIEEGATLIRLGSTLYGGLEGE